MRTLGPLVESGPLNSLFFNVCCRSLVNNYITYRYLSAKITLLLLRYMRRVFPCFHANFGIGESQLRWTKFRAGEFRRSRLFTELKVTKVASASGRYSRAVVKFSALCEAASGIINDDRRTRYTVHIDGFNISTILVSTSTWNSFTGEE